MLLLPEPAGLDADEAEGVCRWTGQRHQLVSAGGGPCADADPRGVVPADPQRPELRARQRQRARGALTETPQYRSTREVM